MAAAAAPTMVRTVAARCVTPFLLPVRSIHLSSSSSSAPFLNRILRTRTSAIYPTFILSSSARFNEIRCKADRSGYSSYSPLKSGGGSGSNFSDRPPTEMAPLFPGCDYEHWLIVMDKPGGEGAEKQQMIDCYVQTLAKVLGRYVTVFI